MEPRRPIILIGGQAFRPMQLSISQPPPEMMWTEGGRSHFVEMRQPFDVEMTYRNGYTERYEASEVSMSSRESGRRVFDFGNAVLVESSVFTSGGEDWN